MARRKPSSKTLTLNKFNQKFIKRKRTKKTKRIKKTKKTKRIKEKKQKAMNKQVWWRT